MAHKGTFGGYDLSIHHRRPGTGAREKRDFMLEIARGVSDDTPTWQVCLDCQVTFQADWPAADKCREAGHKVVDREAVEVTENGFQLKGGEL